MGASLTQAVRQFLMEPRFAVLSTVSPSGRPQATPVWYLLEDDDTVLINTSQNRVKLRNLQHNPYLALVVMDQHNPYRYVQLRGRVVRTDRERGAADIDRLAIRYTGRPYTYRGGDSPDQRVSVVIQPLRVQAQGI